MDDDKLASYLQSWERDDNYRVDRVIKQSPFETTELVYYRGSNGSELGPFIRKRITDYRGLGKIYRRIFDVQKAGERFRHLPRIYDCFDEGDEQVVVMECVSGRTLSDYVREQRPSVSLAATFFPLLCEAVIELHEAFSPPIIHRDLKPTNIIVSHRNLTVIDFGIARSYDEHADTDTHHFGTREYAPPEQFGFGQTDCRSDVYALGMILYFLLTGKEPRGKLAGSSFDDPAIPEALRKVLARATQVDPQNRYLSVKELLLAFQEAVTDISLSSVGPSFPEPSGGQVPLPEPDLATPYQTTYGESSSADSVPPTQWNFTSRIEDEPKVRSRGYKLSLVAGLIWDGAVFLFWCLWIAAIFSTVVWPDENTANLLPLERSIIGFGILLPIITAIGYFILDKRWFREHVAFMSGQTLGASFRVSLVFLAVGIGFFLIYAIVYLANHGISY